MDEYLEHFRRKVLPNIASSIATLVLMSDSEPDPKICLEVGAAILLEKPIIVVAAPGQKLPKMLEKIASAVVVGEVGDEDFSERVAAALKRIR